MQNVSIKAISPSDQYTQRQLTETCTVTACCGNRKQAHYSVIILTKHCQKLHVVCTVKCLLTSLAARNINVELSVKCKLEK